MMTVAKFGGSSLANAERFLNAKKIIDSDDARRIIVPSAPGKEHDDDIKVTDLLYLLHETIEVKQDPSAIWRKIEERFRNICEGIGTGIDISDTLAEVYKRFTRGSSREYAASRGEAINGEILAHLLDAEYIDAAEIIRMDPKGRFDPASYELIEKRCAENRRYVIPGFYGAKPDGSVATFSRGGSDVTGSIVARALQASVYENWTDVSGFRMADPRIVADARRIREMTYGELRELSYMGASVFHEEAIFPVREKGIPIHIKNTNAPEDHGTVIVPDRDNHDQIITGIAGKRDFMVFHIAKAMMNDEIGFGRRVLETFEHFGISIEHMPSGIDTLSIVASREEVGSDERSVTDELLLLHPDGVEVLHGISLIATVGQGMNHALGTAARLFGALAEHHINVRMIDQGSSEQNIIVGVDDDDFEAAIRAIYQAFVE